MADSRTGYTSIYIIVAALIGLVIGAACGLILDPLIGGRRTLAIIAALDAMGAEYLCRRYATGGVRKLFLGAPSAGTTWPRFFASFVIALAGGLAAHDLLLVVNVMNGALLGAAAGLFAMLLKSVLVVLRHIDEGKTASTEAKDPARVS